MSAEDFKVEPRDRASRKDAGPAIVEKRVVDPKLAEAKALVERDSAQLARSSGSTATITGTVFYNDRRKHGLFADRREPDGDVGQRCDPNGVRDDGSACSTNWLGAKYMVVDVIEIDEGFFGPTAWDCKKEDTVASVAVAYDGSFSATISTNDPCDSDKLKKTTIKLSVRTRYCGEWCFSIRDEDGDPYSLYHPGASNSNRVKVSAGANIDVGRMNFNPSGTHPTAAHDVSIAANYYASIVDSMLVLHRDGEIPFYKDTFGEIEFHYPSDKSSTATARAPDEVAISTFESRNVIQTFPVPIATPQWVSGTTPAHEYGHIIMQRAWDGGYGFDGVGISAGDSAKAVSRQIAFKEAWAEYISRAVFEPTRGCDRSSFDDNANTPLNGPLGEGAEWRGNIIKALCYWHDSRDDDDTSLAGKGDYFAAADVYSMWYNLRKMYIDRAKYGGEFKDPGLWFCDYVDYYLDVRKSSAAVGAKSHATYENKIRDLIYNNNIGCFMDSP